MRRAGTVSGLGSTALAAALLLLAAAPLPSASSDSPVEHAPDHVLVSYRTGTSGAVVEALERQVGGSLDRTVLGGDVRVLRVPEGSVPQVVQRLVAHPAVRYAEPDYYMDPQSVPNDPDFGRQWALRNTGQDVNGIRGTPGADIDAVRAWDVTTGKRQVVVGVIDDGVEPDHSELSDNIWRNPGGVNGCPAGTHGYDIVQKRCSHGGSGHGLGVAAVLGAVGDNGKGGTGAAWATSIMSLKIDAFGVSVTSTTTEAIEWAIDARQKHDVNLRVLNLSYTAGGHSSALREAIERAGEAGILFVTGAGNSTRDLDARPVYACSYKTWNTICVTGTDQDDEQIFNYGKSTVHLGAPATNMYRLPGWGHSSGTSEAAPLVSGVAALIWSQDPGLDVATVKGKILHNVDPLPSLKNKTISGGRLNAYKALTGSPPPEPTPTPTPTPTSTPTSTPTPTPTPTPTSTPTSTPTPTPTPDPSSPPPSDDPPGDGEEEPVSGDGGSGGGGSPGEGSGGEDSGGEDSGGGSKEGSGGGLGSPNSKTASGGRDPDAGEDSSREVEGGLLQRLGRSLPGIGRLFGGGGSPEGPEAQASGGGDADAPAALSRWSGAEETEGAGGPGLLVGGLVLLGAGPLAYVGWRRGVLFRRIPFWRRYP